MEGKIEYWKTFYKVPFCLFLENNLQFEVGSTCFIYYKEDSNQTLQEYWGGVEIRGPQGSGLENELWQRSNLNPEMDKGRT